MLAETSQAKLLLTIICFIVAFIMIGATYFIVYVSTLTDEQLKNKIEKVFKILRKV